MTKQIFFRVSVTNKTGIGHFIRSLSLATAIKKNLNFKTKFIINDNKFAKKTLKRNKIPFKISNYSYPTKLEDAKLSYDKKADLLIVDSPIIKKKWVRYFFKKEIKILGIFSKTNSINSVDYELRPESILNKSSFKKKFGLRYSLLSKEYWKKSPKKKKKNINNVLITFGGCDHYDLSSKFIKSLNYNIKKKLNINLVIGQFYNNIKKIKKEIKLSHHNIILIYNPLGIFNYIKNCDLIVNAGGTTLVESCILGKKTITSSVWPSQDKLTKNLLKKKDYIICNNIQTKDLQNIINKKILNIFLNKTKFSYLKDLDGQGCKRISFWIGRIVSN